MKLGIIFVITVSMTVPVRAEETLTGQNPAKVFMPSGIKISVPPEEILPGGPPVDGIPALSNPKKISIPEADQTLGPDDLILGIISGHESVAYPIQILNWHEIVNDTVGGIPVVITYCPLCRTGIAFARTIDGETVEFGVSGLLYKSDLVMYDRKTKSLWSQIMGESIAGPSTGKTLKRLPVIYASWKEWKTANPKTKVATFDTGFDRDYSKDPYRGYGSSSEIYFPVGKVDERLHPKNLIFGLEKDGNAVAVPLSVLKRKKKLNLGLGAHRVRIQYEEGPRAFIENEGEIPGLVAYWFAWFAFHPETRLVGNSQ